jgi:hypothetical protein
MDIKTLKEKFVEKYGEGISQVIFHRDESI